MGSMKARVYETEPVGMVEIAERLQVKQGTVSQWWYRTRNSMTTRLPFPAPRWTVSGYDCWDWFEVEEWAIATGRHPGHPISA